MKVLQLISRPVVVDTSVWIDHFRNGNKELIRLLKDEEILCHPSIIGELACGNLKNRTQILRLLQSLPQALLAQTEEVLNFLEIHHLYGKGIGWIDAHLLVSAKLSGAYLWTLDKRLKALANQLTAA